MNKQNTHLLFIDESGRSKLSDSGNSLLLTGVVVRADLHDALSSYIVSLKGKSEIPTDRNIHAYDVFEGERVRIGNIPTGYRRLPIARVSEFFERLCFLIEGSDMKVIVLQIDLGHFRSKVELAARRHNVTPKAITNYLRKRGLADIAYEVLARKMILDFSHFLESEDSQGAVVIESRRDDDSAVLDAFLAATDGGRYGNYHTFELWANSGHKRINGITFENKKGLSFGLEVADLFCWGVYNVTFGKEKTYDSAAKNRRIDGRLERVGAIIKPLQIRKIQKISRRTIGRVAEDRVSEFAEALNQYRPNTLSLFGDPTR